MTVHSRFERARKWLLFWCLFIGIGAVAGATGMLVAPDGSAMGFQPLLPYFQVLPFAKYLFQNFLFPGIALLCVNGLPNLIAAGLLLTRRRSGVFLGGLFGVTLMLWICIQFVIFPSNFMSTIYFFFGLAQALTGHAAGVFFRQEHFRVDRADYPRIGSDPRQLVVFFSRMGYVRRLAYETANRTGAAVCELVAKEPTQETLGFWWCGRFGMHRWPMPIEMPDVDLSVYEKITLCTPVWVFSLASPMRAFCQSAAGKIKRADYILVHFQRCRYQNVVDEMDALLGVKHETVRSVCCRAGKFLEKSVGGNRDGTANETADSASLGGRGRR